MPIEEKKERNLQIYLDKMGYDRWEDKKPVKKTKTYRTLVEEHELSLSTIQNIVNRYRIKKLREEQNGRS